jgi:transposase
MPFDKMATKRKQMSTPVKDAIISMSLSGYSQREIADILKVSQSGVSKFLKRYTTRGSSENSARSGRPRKTDDRGDRKILRCVKSNRRQTLKDITDKVNSKLPNSISSRTVRRRLRFSNFTRRKTRKTLTIRSESRTRRVNWCRGKLNWTVNNNWKKVIFSDETQVFIDQNKSVNVWRRPDEIW